MKRRPRKSFQKFSIDEFFCQPKICNFNHSILQQNISWLKIAMDNFIHSKHLHAFDYLGEKRHGLSFLHPTPGFDEVSQSAVLAVLEKDIEIVARLLNIDEVDDVFMFAFAQQVDLSF